MQILTHIDPADPARVKFRTFKGRRVKAKPAAERVRLAERIKAIDADVLAAGGRRRQHPDRVRHTDLARHGYRHVVLVEGNDPGSSTSG